MDQDYGITYVNTIAKDYQRVGIGNMFNWKRAYQADDMGLGKTLQTLTAIELHEGVPGITIIVCPKFALGVWAAELDKWFKRKSRIYSGTPAQRRNIWREFITDSESKYLITNFAMLPEMGHLCGIRNTKCPHPTWYEAAKDDTPLVLKALVIDEAHFSGIFNYKTKFYKAAQQVFKIAELKYILTGTPMRQGCVDFYGPLSCLDPVRFNSYWNYIRDWCVTIKTPFGLSIERNPSNLVAFREMLSGYMIRRNKEEVLSELLGKQRQLLSVAMSKQQHRLYAELEAELMTLIPETGDLVITPTMMSCILRQRQVLASPKILGASDYGTGVEAIIEHSHLRLDEDVPVVVFTSFRSILPILEDRFRKEYPGIPIYKIQGGLKADEFTAAWQNFQGGTGKAVLLVVIKSGASFQATRADTAYFIAPEWDVSLNLQAEDRLNRIGQKKFVNIFYVDYDTPVDQRVRLLLNSKMESSQFMAGTAEEYIAAIQKRNI